MADRELIYLGRMRVITREPLRIGLESLGENEWASGNVKFHKYAQLCARNGFRVAAKFLDIDVVGFSAVLAVFSEEEGDMFPQLMLSDGRVLDWNARHLRSRHDQSWFDAKS
jgi:hypothetical protein